MQSIRPRAISGARVLDLLRTPHAAGPWLSAILCVTLPLACTWASHLVSEDLQAFSVLLYLVAVALVTYVGRRLAGYIAVAISAGALSLSAADVRPDWLSLGGAVWDDLLVFLLVSFGLIELLTAAISAFARLKESNRQASALAAERQVLLSEIQHRTGNNLQMISSLLHLQAREVDAGAARALRDAANRVAAVANIQRRLYETEGALISFERIVTGLASDMAEVNDARITCFVSPDLGSPPPGAAGPLTLVLQELIANAVEHGRVPGRKLEVVVSLRRHNLHLARLVVEDNGPGLPAHFHEDTSLGLKLVRVLASQIGSDFRLQNRPDGHAGAVASLMVVLASASEDSGSQEPAAAELTSSSAAPA